MLRAEITDNVEIYPSNPTQCLNAASGLTLRRPAHRPRVASYWGVPEELSLAMNTISRARVGERAQCIGELERLLKIPVTRTWYICTHMQCSSRSRRMCRPKALAQTRRSSRVERRYEDIGAPGRSPAAIPAIVFVR